VSGDLFRFGDDVGPEGLVEAAPEDLASVDPSCSANAESVTQAIPVRCHRFIELGLGDPQEADGHERRTGPMTSCIGAQAEGGQPVFRFGRPIRCERTAEVLGIAEQIFD
jgi:hypothetical protein